MARGRKRIATEASGAPLEADNPFAGLDDGTLGVPGRPDPETGAEAPPEPVTHPAGKQATAASKRPGPRPRLDMRREVRGRGGKTVTALHAEDLRREDYARNLLRELKHTLGCGGSTDPSAGALFLQGDRTETLPPLLEARGFRVVRTGG